MGIGCGGILRIGMLTDKIKKYKLILASGSPRRSSLISGLDFDFTVEKNACEDESFDDTLPLNEVAIYLADKKSDHFLRPISENEILITADTIVICDERVLNKPSTVDEAFEMLKFLSGKTHTVSTGVTIRTSIKRVSFSDETEVKFKELTDDEIIYYIEHYKPFDKAGSYGAQDWIGLVAIEKINGSYFNIMGFPVHRFYSEIEKLISEI